MYSEEKEVTMHVQMESIVEAGLGNGLETGPNQRMEFVFETVLPEDANDVIDDQMHIEQGVHMFEAGLYTGQFDGLCDVMETGPDPTKDNESSITTEENSDVLYNSIEILNKRIDWESDNIPKYQTTLESLMEQDFELWHSEKIKILASIISELSTPSKI